MQQHYSAFDRELFAAYAAIRHFRHFVDERSFTFFSDHKPFVHALSSRGEPIIPTRSRPMSYISEFTNDVRHLHGDQNVVADALSRVEINNVKFFQEGLNYNVISKAQQDDAFIKYLIENSSESSLKISEVKIEDSDQVILYGVSTDKVRPIIPEQFQKVVFDKIHNLAHSCIKAAWNLLQRRFVRKNMKKSIRDWVKCCVSCQKGKIIRHNKSP